jgi:hypothetical protein
LVQGLLFYSETGLPQGRSPAVRHPLTCPVATQASGDCFLVWVFITDQSGMGDPTSSYTTAILAPWLIRTLKPHHQRQGHAILRWGSIILLHVIYFSTFLLEHREFFSPFHTASVFFFKQHCCCHITLFLNMLPHRCWKTWRNVRTVTERTDTGSLDQLILTHLVKNFAWILWNPTVHYHNCSGLLVMPIHSQPNQACTFRSYLFIIHY